MSAAAILLGILLQIMGVGSGGPSAAQPNGVGSGGPSATTVRTAGVGSGGPS